MEKTIMTKIEKSLKSISWCVEEDEYRADPAYSYSTIAKFDREGFDKLETLFDKVESPSLLFGSCVDTLLTDGQKAFDERFMVADFNSTPDAVRKIVDEAFNMFSAEYTSLIDIPEKKLAALVDTFEFQKNWKLETRVKKVITDGSEYYSLLYVAGNKQIITSTLYQDVVNCVDTLRQSPSSSWYFQKDNPFAGNIERLYQLKFKGEYEGIPLRIMADLIIVDHDKKIIIPCDLKTSYKEEWNFWKSFIEWRYYIQANLYSEIIRQNIEKDEYFKDFKIMDYRFIVICNRTRVPLVWEWPYTKTEVDFALNNTKFTNWRGIVKQLDYYLKSKTPVPEDIVQNEPNNLAHFILKYGN